MKLITMTAHLYCTVQNNQEFKTGLPMSVLLRVHGEKVNKKARQVDGILIKILFIIILWANIQQCVKKEKQRERSQNHC